MGTAPPCSHPLALVPWPGLPTLLLFLVSGFTSVPRIEEPATDVGAEPGKLRGEKEEARVASRYWPQCGGHWGPIAYGQRFLRACKELHPELVSAGPRRFRAMSQSLSKQSHVPTPPLWSPHAQEHRPLPGEHTSEGTAGAHEEGQRHAG